MQLDRLAIALRQRNGFESLDLGFPMCNAWRGPLIRAWLATYGATALLLSVVLWEYPTVVFLLVWWLKPLFDRVLLHVYAQAMFGSPPATRDVLRALPAILRRTRLVAGLTTFRLSPARSLFLPVWQLEQQRGPAARARRRVLGARTYGCATWLTIVCSNMAGFWCFGAYVIVRLLMPEDAAGSWSFTDLFTLDPEVVWIGHATNLVAFAVDTVIEPYYVGAGFSLYLNRRSELEGWDLEVEFRRMAMRRARPSPIAAAAAVLCLAVGLAVTAADVHAQSPASASRIASLPLPPGEARREAKAVLADPVFGEKLQSSRWVPRTRDDAKTPEWMRPLRDFMKRAALFLGAAGRMAIWAVGGLAFAVAIWLLIRHHGGWWPRPARRLPRDVLFGLDVRPESLPDDVAAAAKSLLTAGDTAGALSLLYRGALSALIHRKGVDFRSGDTEGDCWRRAAPALSAAGGAYFRALLDAWVATVYAHRPPSAPRLLDLCEVWPAHFHESALAPEAQR